MSEQKLQRIREVAADCPNPVAGKFIDYDLGAAARNALPELLAEYDALRQRAEAAEAELAAIPYRQLYDVWHSGDEGYTIRDADDVAVWLAKWKLKQPA